MAGPFPNPLAGLGDFFNDLGEPAFPRDPDIALIGPGSGSGLTLTRAFLLGALLGGAWLFIRSVR